MMGALRKRLGSSDFPLAADRRFQKLASRRGLQPGHLDCLLPSYRVQEPALVSLPADCPPLAALNTKMEARYPL